MIGKDSQPTGIPLEPNSPQQKYVVEQIREYLSGLDLLPGVGLEVLALDIWRITQTARRPVKGRRIGT